MAQLDEEGEGIDEDVEVLDPEEVLDSDDDEEDAAFLRSRREIMRPRSSFFDFVPERMSRTQVLKRLIFCSLMLNVTFVLWGVLQVRTTCDSSSRERNMDRLSLDCHTRSAC